MAISHAFQNFAGLLALLLALTLDLSSAVLIDASRTNISASSFDYVIVGCGISGLVLANRLTEEADASVICLEAGGLWVIQRQASRFQTLMNYRDQNEDFIRYPIYIGLQPPCAYEWCLTSVLQPQLDGQVRRMPMGRGVGGGSLTNGMLWNRGGQIDFQNWEKLGNLGWGWDDMLPYFKKVRSTVL